MYQRVLNILADCRGEKCRFLTRGQAILVIIATLFLGAWALLALY